MSEPLLASSGLNFAYATTPVLRDISVSLQVGEVVALLGPNGSGKTTLIRALLGQLRCSSGSIQWDGRELRRWSRKQLARRVAYLSQSPTYEPDDRVADVLRLGRAPYLRAFGLESAADLQAVDRVADLLQLKDLLDRPMRQLSGGQRQRVFVGRCLVQEPAAMLLDEPSTFLDLKHQIELATLLRQLAREKQIGVFMASHDLNLSSELADRVILLKDGSIVGQGTPSEVLQPELLSKIYDVPMSRIDHEGRPIIFPRLNRTPSTG